MVGMEEIYLHELLHSYASALAGSGVNLYPGDNCLGMLMWQAPDATRNQPTMP